jgi:hypothetical protein
MLDGVASAAATIALAWLTPPEPAAEPTADGAEPVVDALVVPGFDEELHAASSPTRAALTATARIADPGIRIRLLLVNPADGP